MSRITCDIVYYEKFTNIAGESSYKSRNNIPAYEMLNICGVGDISNTEKIYQTVAIVNETRFQTYEGIKYFVILFQIDKDEGAFEFEKWYPMNKGYNEELIKLLLALKAVHRRPSFMPKDIATDVDFDNVKDYEYDIYYQKDWKEDCYNIVAIEPQEESYSSIEVFVDFNKLFCEDNLSLLEEEEAYERKNV